MGFNDEYQKLRKKRLEQEGQNQSGGGGMLYRNKTATAEDIAPVVTSKKTETTEKDEDEGKKWWQGFAQLGDALSDGYQFGDVTKTLLGTDTDIATNLVSGVVGWGENAADAVATGLGVVSEKLGWNDTADKMREFAQKDLYDENAVARKILSNGRFIGAFAPELAPLGLAMNAMFTVEDWLNSEGKDNSVLGDVSDSMIQSAGETVVKMGAPGIGNIITGVTVFGEQAEQALNEDATFMQAAGSGAISAAAEIMFEKLSSGIKIGGRTLDEGLTRILSKNISNVALRTALNFGLDVAGEAGEEVATEFVSKLGTKLYKEEDLGEILASEDALTDYIQAAIGGGLMGGAFNVSGAVSGAKQGVDYKTGLSNDESRVVDKIADERIKEQTEDGKLTAKEQEKIREQVMRDLERGRISVDDIERILGGASYQAYRDMADTEDAKQAEVQKKIEELENLPNEKITFKQAETLKGLRQELQGLKDSAAAPAWKNRVSENVMWRASGTRLAESYRERARRGQAFEADLSQYDAKQAEIVKKAVESGILNNTGRTHEFVDMVAKISADKGVLFDFVNNSKLKESGFAVEGATVNGYFDKKTNTVGVNIDSAKAFDTVVGHEITHVIEGTELYSELQKAVFDYAKTKGEYDGRREALAKLYAEEDINAEMTADLVGEYLFTDEDFVNNLSVTNRNVFQKIYDEIKYLYKVVTAGSKEARELERVKRAFDKAYKESGKASGDVKHSLSGDKYADTFYSHMAKVVDGVKQEKLGADSVVNMLRGKGVKAEEIKWSGIESFLEGKKSVTKQELQEFIAGNQLQIEEDTRDNRMVVEYMDSETGELYLNDDELVSMAYDRAEAQGFNEDDVRTDWNEGKVTFYVYKDGQETIILEANQRTDFPAPTKWGEYILDGGYNYREFVFKMPNSEYSNAAMRVHWGEDTKGVLAHARVQDFETANGKMLFVEEIQSDWHNEGAKEGYKSNRDKAKIAAEIDAMEAELDKIDREYKEAIVGWDAFTALANPDAYKAADALAEKRKKVVEKLEKLYDEGAEVDNEFSKKAPDAPFRDNYHEYVLKRLIREAAENGYDSIGWTTADIQSKRWSEEYAEGYRIEYDQDIPKFLNKYGKKWGAKAELSMLDQGWSSKYETRIASEQEHIAYWQNELSDATNEGSADFIREQIRYHEKQIKAMQVTGEIVWSMPITPAMKQSVLYEGQPKYSLSDSDGKQLTRGQQEYFKDSKMRDENGNLKVMYHGSQDAGFHVFDAKMSDDDTSFFFVDRNDVAASYSGTTETYEAQSIRTAEDMNKFIESIGVEGYEVLEHDGKFDLIYEDDLIASRDTAKEIYEEFCWYEGVGEGDANYKVYLNLKNPLVVDGKGRPWNKIDAEFSQEVYDKYQSLTAEEKDALTDLAEWEDFSLFNSEIQEATEGDLASAYAKMGEDCNIYDLFSVAADNFSEESMRENARGYLKTRDYAQRAKEQGYDGVIFKNIVDNGGFSNGSEGASTVAIAFESSQIKSVANENPTGDADIRYSLSEDSEGRELSPAVKNRFGNSKVVDENGSLKVVYHGTAAGEFSIFDKSKGSVEGDFGSGFYFTDSQYDVANNYEDGGPDFDNKVARRAEQIEAEEDIDYDEAEERARAELYKGGHKFEVYLNIENPAIVGETLLFEPDSYYSEYNKEDYDSEDDYYGEVEQLVADDIDGIIWDIEQNVDINSTDGIADVLWDAFNVDGLDLETLKRRLNNLYLEDSYGNMVGNEVARQIVESLGYDGIIDPTVSTKWNMDMEPGTTHYIVFKPNQIKAVTNQTPTDNPDIHKSLSTKGEAPGKGRFYGKDIRLEVAPVAEDVSTTTEQAAPVENIAPVADWMPDTEETYAPSLYDLLDERDALQEQLRAAMEAQDQENGLPLIQRYQEITAQIKQLEAEENARLASLDDADVPPEVEAPYYESEPQAVTLDKAAAESVAKGVEEMLYINDKKQSAKLGEVVQRYSEHQSREQLVAELKENFGTITETYTDDHLAEVKSFLRTYRLSVSDHIKSDYENFNETRKHFFGKLRITKNGVPVDSAYMELSEMFPQYFPEDIDNEFEQFERILDVADTLSTFEKEIGELSEEEIYAVADKIIGDIQALGRAQNEKAAEAYFSDLASSFAANEQYMPMAEDIAPLKNNKIEVEVEPIEDAKPIKTVKDRIEGKLRNSEAELSRNERLQRESAASFNEKIASVRAEYNAKANKDTKVANNLLRRIERLQRLRDDVDADYAKRINDNRAKVDKYKAQMEQGFGDSESREMRADLHHGIVDRIKTSFADKGFDFDRVLKNAKNLSTFATVDNTPQRVMEKSLGYKEGQILADETVNKVAQNETEGIKWLNSYTDRKSGLLAQISKQYQIKPGSKESAAAQMYAEGFFVGENGETIAYSDAELAKDFPDARTRENIKGLAGDPRIRQIYDETLAMINESRARNAYPEIQKLDNYFLHFRAMDDTFSRLGLPFNPNDIKAKDLPTDLNGVTADLKPGQPYFASSMHRRGNRTSYDLLGGLERYLTGAKSQIYHIDDIQTLRALRNYIADTYGQANGLESLDELTEEEAQERIKQVYGAHLSTFAKFLNEEANVIAGKTALIDRGLEGIIGRRGMTFMDSINKQVGSNMVGFNVSSSLTNFLPVVQAFAKTNKYAFVKGFAQTVSNRVGSIAGKGDGFAENSPVMIRREGADRFYRTPFQKVGDAGYALMGAVDSISTEIIARAKFNELTRKGMSETQAHYETDKWVSRLMGDRSLGQMPQLYNSKMLGLVTKFQLEVRNQLDSQFYDTIQEAKVSNEHIENQLARNAKTAAKVASTFFQLAVAQHLFGAVFESIAGYNPAFDIIEVIIKSLGLDDDEESEDTVLDNVEQGFLALLEDLPYTSTLTGGRIPITNALPIEQLIKGKDDYGNDKPRWKTVLEALPYYVSPGGYGQAKKTAQGLGMFSDKLPVTGSYTDSGNLRFPVEKTPGNIAQAAVFGQWANENARYYFDNDIAPLNPKQTQEYADVGMSIRDYWKYRKGLSGLKTLEERAEYIDSLDLTDEQKNILINNIVDREEDIDMSDYDQYGSFGEFDFAAKNPEKYEFFKANGISYEDYDNADEDGKRAYTWAYENPEKYTVAKAISDDFLTYYKYKGELYDIKADKDENGESIRGSAKDKKIDYINNLDLDYGQRIILFKSLYNADDTYNADIVDYLNNREDISYDEMVTILTELGFTVKNGNVYWE